jgi:hypothetical protein
MEKTKRARGPNTRQLLYSISVLNAAIEVLRDKVGFTEAEFDKLTDTKYDEMFPSEANSSAGASAKQKEEVVI